MPLDDREPGASSSDQGTAEQNQSIPDTVANILEEARMILPGAQTLFGFQLIVVFNARFHDELSATEEHLHLAATMLVAVTTATLIAPAAYHRIAEPESVSRAFVVLAGRLLSWRLVPLALAICADFYRVASLVTQNQAVSLALTAAVFIVFAGLWFVLPTRALR